MGKHGRDRDSMLERLGLIAIQVELAGLRSETPPSFYGEVQRWMMAHHGWMITLFGGIWPSNRLLCGSPAQASSCPLKLRRGCLKPVPISHGSVVSSAEEAVAAGTQTLEELRQS